MNDEEKSWLLTRIRQAEQRIGQLETDLQKANKRITSGVGIFVFVLIAFMIYHYGWVKPIVNAHNNLVDTFNDNVNKYNENIYR